MDIGPVVSKSIYDFFQEKRNLKFIEKLIKVDVRIIEEKKPKQQPLKGKTFVLTGSLESLTREEAKEKIRFLGGKISESVSQKVDFVVIGKEPGSKFQIAKKLGIKTLSEKQFLQLL
jgi:DNA ligase (NAD+)